jgi:hypothetical protein
MIFRVCLVDKCHDMRVAKREARQEKERKRRERELKLQYENYP